MKRFPAYRLWLGIAICNLALVAQTSDTAYQQTIRLDIPDSSGFAFATVTVPTGKRLILRYLAVSSTLPSGQRFTSSVQATLVGIRADKGSTAEFAQAYTSQANGDGTDELVSNQQVTIQADSDTTLYFQVFRRIPKGAIRVVFAISGDLIPTPQL